MAQLARPSKTRIARLAALGAFRDEWEDRHLGEAAFMPEGRKADSDYNQHYLDVDPPARAESEFARRALEITGQHAMTGRVVDGFLRSATRRRPLG